MRSCVSIHPVVPLQVSATFAASLVISPSLGNLIIDNYPGQYGERKVIALATLVSVLNLAFILFCVPESLPESVRKSSWGSAISWEQADPFAVRVCAGMACVCVLLLAHVTLKYTSILYVQCMYVRTYTCSLCTCIGIHVWEVMRLVAVCEGVCM